MATKPKCKACGCVIEDKDFAFVVQKGKKKEYYCTQAEYNEILQIQINRNESYKIAKRICGASEFSVFLKTIVDKHMKNHGVDKIFSLLQEYEDTFTQRIESKGIDKLNQRIGYLDACIKSMVDDYYYAEPIEFQPVECEEVIELHKYYKPVTHKKCLADYFKEVEV